MKKKAGEKNDDAKNKLRHAREICDVIRARKRIVI